MSDEEKKPGDVIPLRPLSGALVDEKILPAEVTSGPIVRRTFGLRGYCMHRSVVVDVEGRIVVCRACDVELDPIAALGMLAHAPEALVFAIKEQRSVQARIELLRAEEKKLAGRMRGQKRRAPAERGELELLRRLEAAYRSQRHDLACKALNALDELRKELGA